MSNISAQDVRTLRDKTGAGMMDCKKALSESGGDIESASDWLRKKGLATARKKAGRVASEGLVGLALSGTRGALIEVNAETDFVARNEMFQDFVKKAVTTSLETDGSEKTILASPWDGGDETIEAALTRHIATIGENMSFRRASLLSVKKGLVAGYVHGAVSPGLGRIGVLVALETEASGEKIEALGKHLAMHIAAASPEYNQIDQVEEKTREREKSVFAEQARASGKPEEIISKMVEGRLKKFYEETVLHEQVFAIDGKTRIRDLIADEAKSAGADITISGFIRFGLGEGIDKRESDFAAEVAASLGG